MDASFVGNVFTLGSWMQESRFFYSRGFLYLRYKSASDITRKYVDLAMKERKVEFIWRFQVIFITWASYGNKEIKSILVSKTKMSDNSFWSEKENIIMKNFPPCLRFSEVREKKMPEFDIRIRKKKWFLEFVELVMQLEKARYHLAIENTVKWTKK